MLMFLLGFFFVGSLQPVVMVGSLIMITLLYSYMIFCMMGGYWFGYALVLVMLSGVLVVFTYMVSLIPNESFENYNLLLLFFVLLVLMIGYNYMYMVDMNYLCLILWGSYVSIYNLFMVGFLFSIMLMVVWFGCVGEGAIRIGY